jgi:ribonuclease Z
MLDICLLGTGGMMPLPDRYLTALLARYNGRKLLIDCGEGTQVTMKLVGWGFKTLDIICFTHYHGDHVTGLPGLLLTLGNAGRTEPLTLIGPPGLKRVVAGLTVVCRDITFPLELIELPFEAGEIKIGEFQIEYLPVTHKVPCFAYNIINKRDPKFLPEKARANQIPLKHWKLLQKGETVCEEGIIYTPEMVQGEGRKGIKVSYCTDARPSDELVAFIKEADLFICEGMYLETSYLDQVKKYKHMLGTEAAYLAQRGKVKQLWLTHFSPAVPNSYIDMKAVKEVFENAVAGVDRKMVTLGFEE